MLSESSVFIGLSAPLNVGGLLDFSKEITEFFEKYKKGLLDYIPDAEGKKALEQFYKPANYILLSPFDIATLALVDDFDLGCSAFHPLDQHWPRTEDASGKKLSDLVKDRRTFFHQTIMGPMPRFSEDDSKDPKKIAIDCLFERPLPLLGICQLEMQNGLLIGAGSDLLRCVVRSIRRHFDAVRKLGSGYFHDDVQLLILESHAWHELTLLLFACSFEDIIHFVTDIREWNLTKVSELLLTSGGSNARTRIRDTEDLQLLQGDSTLTDVYCRVKGGGTKSVDSHLLTCSATTLGFRVGLCNTDDTRLLERVCGKDKLYVTRRCSARPGHLHDALAAVLNTPSPVENPDARFLVCAGREDITYPVKLEVSSRQLLDQMMPLLTDKTRYDAISRHVNASTTSVCHSGVGFGPHDDDDTEENAEAVRVQLPHVADATHPYSRDICAALPHVEGVGLCVDDVKKTILEPLKLRGIPDVVAARLLNAYALLAQGLQDPHLLSSMLEVLPYMQGVQRRIGAKWDWRELEKDTADFARDADRFELAWHNRFRGGWRMGEVSDFTLEYKGGIEQLVSAFDAAYKSLSGELAGNREVLALISSAPFIESDPFAVRLNYHDIFTPEFFAFRAAHEAAGNVLAYKKEANHLTGRLIESYPTLAKYLAVGPAAQRKLREEKRASDVWVNLNKALDTVAAFIESGKATQTRLSNERVHELRTIMSPEFLRHVFSDVCLYHTTYLEHPRPFIYWDRGGFVVDFKHWKEGSYQLREGKDSLKRALLRLALVLCKDPGPDSNPNQDSIRENQATVKFGQKYWAELLNRQEKEQDRSSFFPDAMHFAEALYRQRSDLCSWLTNAHRWIEQLVRKHLPQIRQRTAEHMQALASGYVPRMTLSEVSWMDRGNLAKVVEQAQDDCFVHTVALSHAFLRLLMKEATGATGDDFDNAPRYKGLLIRDEKTGIIDKSAGSHPEDGKLLFDPRGGTFTWDAEFRGRYFMYRCAYTASLADMAARAKVFMPELRKAVDLALKG